MEEVTPQSSVTVMSALSEGLENAMDKIGLLEAQIREAEEERGQILTSLAEARIGLDAALTTVANLGARLKDVETGRDAIQARENTNLEELRALRRLETAVRNAIHVYNTDGRLFANPHKGDVMKGLSDLNELRGAK